MIRAGALCALVLVLSSCSFMSDEKVLRDSASSYAFGHTGGWSDASLRQSVAAGIEQTGAEIVDVDVDVDKRGGSIVLQTGSDSSSVKQEDGTKAEEFTLECVEIRLDGAKASSRSFEVKGPKDTTCEDEK